MIMSNEKDIIIENINSFHRKIRDVSYWHFIFVNNGHTNPLDEYFSYKTNKTFKKELKYLISESESYNIFEKYLKSEDNIYYITYNDLSGLIKDITFRICCNLISKMSEIEIIEVLWDSDLENFSFKINPDYLKKDIITTNDFLSNMYKLACKYLKLKNHYKLLKSK
jgi:hypothetical protein